MNRKKLVVVGLTVAVVAIVAVFLLRRPPTPPAPPVEAPKPAPEAVTPAPPAVPPAEAVAPSPEPVPVAPEAPPVVDLGRPRLEIIVPEDGSSPIRMVHVRADQVLAIVNGVSITLKDLLPLDPAQAGMERAMTAEMYDHLLDRAIEREVTMQAARQNGLELDEDQQRQLEQIRARAMETDPASFTQAHDNVLANTAFQTRDFTSLMLQGALLAQAGGPPQHVSPELVQQYYEQHEGEYGELPTDPAEREAAWQQIELAIRQKLAGELDMRYQEALRKLLNQLRAQANITVATPTP